jgi:hypothetical protein
MRTKPPHILPGCPYCNEDHNPDNECREMPESPRFQLPERKPPQPVRPRRLLLDASGKLVAVRREG